MVLISLDLPLPFEPKMHTCSPELTFNETSFNAALSPRITVTWLKARSGGSLDSTLIIRAVSLKKQKNSHRLGARNPQILWSSNKREVKTRGSHLPGWWGVDGHSLSG